MTVGLKVFKRTLAQASFLTGLAVLSLLAVGGLAHADFSAQGFSANSNLPTGEVVALTKSSNTTVEPAPAADSSRIYGVVVAPTSSPITLEGSGKQVFVATSGSYPILVNTSQGIIKAGDYLSISTKDGVAAKASNSQTFVVGRALGSFGSLSGGSAQNGQIAASLNITANPAYQKDTNVPAPLRRVGFAVAGQAVSSARIYIAAGLFIVASAIALSLLWVGVRSGLISIGRNPLSRPAILAGLAQVVAVAGLVFLGGLFGVYLLLRL